MKYSKYYYSNLSSYFPTSLYGVSKLHRFTPNEIDGLVEIASLLKKENRLNEQTHIFPNIVDVHNLVT